MTTDVDVDDDDDDDDDDEAVLMFFQGGAPACCALGPWPAASRPHGPTTPHDADQHKRPRRGPRGDDQPEPGTRTPDRQPTNHNKTETNRHSL